MRLCNKDRGEVTVTAALYRAPLVGINCSLKVFSPLYLKAQWKNATVNMMNVAGL